MLLAAGAVYEQTRSWRYRREAKDALPPELFEMIEEYLPVANEPEDNTQQLRP